MKLTTHLSTPWGWKAELALLADLQRTVYPYKSGVYGTSQSKKWGYRYPSYPRKLRLWQNVRANVALISQAICNDANQLDLSSSTSPLVRSPNGKHYQWLVTQPTAWWRTVSIGVFSARLAAVPAEMDRCYTLWECFVMPWLKQQGWVKLCISDKRPCTQAALPLTAYGRIIRQKIWLKRPKLDGPAYEYAQNKMAGVHVHRKIISRRAVWRLLRITFIMPVGSRSTNQPIN